MEKQALSKNEYLALELTKAWAGQFGTPVSYDKILNTYERLLRELEEDN